MTNVARYARAERTAGVSARADSASNVIEFLVVQAADLTRFLDDLGALPANVRIDATISVSRCINRYAGVAFGLSREGGAMSSFSFVLAETGVARMLRIGSGARPIGNGLEFQSEVGHAEFRHQFTIEVRGRTATAIVDGGARNRFEIDRDGSGMLGFVSSGGGCYARIESITVSPLP